MNKSIKITYFTYWFGLVLSLMQLSENASAQNYTYSAYSAFGLGLLENNGITENFGMGTAGIALPSERYLNTLNPASFSSIDSTSFIFEVGAFGKYSKLESQGTSLNKLGASVRYIALGFKVAKWWGIAGGLAPFSTRGYTIVNIYPTDGYNDTYQSTITGSGSINRAYIGNAFRPFKNLSIGFNASYLFGSLEQTEQITYSAINYYGMNIVNSNHFNNFTFDAGVQYKATFGIHTILAGVTYNPSQNLSVRTNKLVVNSPDTLQNDRSVYTSFSLPAAAGIGLGYYWKDQVKVFADYTFQQWSKTNYHYVVAQLTDSRQYNFGIEYAPERRINTGYWNAVEYRAGFRHEDSYLVMSGTQIKESAISLGLSLPLRNQFSKINVSAEFGQQGTLVNQLIKESYIRFTIGLTLRDRWAPRPRYD